MLQEKIEFFENYPQSSMDRKSSKKGPSNKKPTNSNSSPLGQDKVKKFITDLTEIRRPQNKTKSGTAESDVSVNASVGSNTIPRSKNRKFGDHSTKTRSSIRRPWHSHRKHTTREALSSASSSNSSELSENKVFQMQVKRHSEEFSPKQAYELCRSLHETAKSSKTIEKKRTEKHPQKGMEETEINISPSKGGDSSIRINSTVENIIEDLSDATSEEMKSFNEVVGSFKVDEKKLLDDQNVMEESEITSFSTKEQHSIENTSDATYEENGLLNETTFTTTEDNLLCDQISNPFLGEVESSTQTDLSSEDVIESPSVVELTDDDVERLTYEFAEKLKRKRIASTIIDVDDDAALEEPKQVQDDEGTPHKINEDIEEQTINEAINYECIDEFTSGKEYDLPNHLKIPASQSQSEDDIFGLNDFDDQDDDNYVIEAFNDDERELIFTYFEIKRKYVSADEDEAQKDTTNNDSDIVVSYENQDFDNDSEGSTTNNFINEVECVETNNTADEQKDCEVPHNGNVEIGEEPIYVDAVYAYVDSPGLHSNRESMKRIEPLYANITDDNENLFNDNYYCNTYSYGKDMILGNVHDEQGNLRIQRTAPLDPEPKKDKITLIVNELIETEIKYIKGLRKVVEDYIPYVERNLSNNLLGKTSYLFGNIRNIYEASQKFLSMLKEDPSSVENIAKVFISSSKMFSLYPLYSKNKPTADVYLKEFDDIVKARQRQLGDRLDLASYLLTPIQRLGKYILMLENIQKELKKRDNSSENVEAAIAMIKKFMRKGNDSIAIDSIKNCTINLSLQGSFIMREKFNILKPRKVECMVFLFEKVIVFAVNTTKGIEEFNYMASIAMNDLTIAILEEKPLVFHLTDYPKAKKSNPDLHTYVLEAKTPKIKTTWTSTIAKRLWDQLAKAKEHLQQLHDDQGKRTSRCSIPNKAPKGETKRQTRWYK